MTMKTLFQLAAASLLLLHPVLAAEPVEVREFAGCRAIVSDAERLLCYDSIADSGVYNEKKLQQVQKENFGDKEKLSDVSVDRLTVTIVRVQKSGTGIHFFYTSDDAVWKQSNRRSWNLKAPFEAEIKSGMLGSYFLVTEGGKSERVKRVK